jgi:hypothetical protein
VESPPWLLEFLGGGFVCFLSKNYSQQRFLLALSQPEEVMVRSLQRLSATLLTPLQHSGEADRILRPLDAD